MTCFLNDPDMEYSTTVLIELIYLLTKIRTKGKNITKKLTWNKL